MSSEQPGDRPDDRPTSEGGAADGARETAESDGELDGETVTVDDGELIETTTEQVVVRRSPRYFRFMFVGAVVGALAALILTFAFPANDQFSSGQVFGFLLLLLGVIGVALGAVVALLIDRRMAKHAETTSMEHDSAHPLG